MRSSLMLAILAVSVAGPVSANPMVTNFPGDPPYIANPLAHVYEPGPRYTATEVLAKLRRVCRSNQTTDKRACSRGMAVLNRAHVELQVRRAAASAITD